MSTDSQIGYLGGLKLQMGNVNIVPYFLVCGSNIPQICLIRIMAQIRKSHVIMKKRKCPDKITNDKSQGISKT